MAAIAYTLVRSTPHQLVYAWTGDAAGDLTYATLTADAVNGPLKAALAAAAGLTDTNAKATACLITGSFALSALSSGFSDIETSVVYEVIAAAEAAAGLTATADGGNSPQLTLTPDASVASGWLCVTHRWSPTV
jgi:hypothetical protein